MNKKQTTHQTNASHKSPSDKTVPHKTASHTMNGSEMTKRKPKNSK